MMTKIVLNKDILIPKSWFLYNQLISHLYNCFFYFFNKNHMNKRCATLFIFQRLI